MYGIFSDKTKMAKNTKVFDNEQYKWLKVSKRVFELLEVYLEIQARITGKFHAPVE
jgi:hypothetical protein